MGDKRRYYHLEWDYAIIQSQQRDLKIMPIIIDDSKNEALNLRDEFRALHMARLIDGKDLPGDFLTMAKDIQIEKRSGHKKLQAL